MSTTVTYKGSTLTTADNNTKTLKTSGKYLEDDITLVDVSSAPPTLQTKTNIDPTTSSQTIMADNGYDGLDSVQINAMPTMTLPTSTAASATSGYTSKATVSRSTADQYINIPTGYNANGAYYKVNATPDGAISIPGSISGTTNQIGWNSSINTITLGASVSVAPVVDTAGYISSVTPATTLASITANCMIRQSNSLTVSGDTVTALNGYYPSNVSASVASGTAGTPTATKGTVANNSISVTPSVTNTTGYITGSTINGTAVTVSASELVSGSETKTANGTYDVTNLAELVVNVSSTNSYLLLGSKDFTTSSTSTSNTKLEDFAVPSAANAFKDSANIIYVRIRDKAGSRNGYFFGSDNYFVNPKATGNQGQTVAMRYIYTYNNDAFGAGPYGGTTGYGVYCQYTGAAGTNGILGIYRRYNSNYSLTINGTYTVEVYILKGPSNKSPWVV